MSRIAVAAALAAVLLASPAFAGKVTNQSVIDLAKARMSDAVIISAIQTGTPDFDTSSKGLIALKNAGASDEVIQAILSASAPLTAPVTAAAASRPAPAVTAATTAAAVAAAELGMVGGFTPETATLIDSGKTSQLKYLTPNIRSVDIPFAGSRSYASLQGPRAALRTSNRPKFVIAVPNNAQPESYFTLAHLAQQKNGQREVLIDGGFYGSSTGITKSRIVPVTSMKAANQSGVTDGFTYYELSPTSQLPAGEYALVLYSSVVRSRGWFLSGLDSYFDFGVD